MYLRRLAAVTAAVTMTVALGACTSDDSDDEEAADSSSSAAPEATPDLPEATVGDALEIGEATLTVHMMTRGSECDYGSDGELPADAELVQLRAEVDNGGDAGLTLDPVNVVYEDGSSADWPAEMKDGGTGCIQADHSDEYYNWSEELPVGGPTYVYGNVAVPEGAGFLNVSGYRFEIPEDSVDDGESATNIDGEAAGAAPTVVACEPGIAGPALWSDGTTAYSQECADEVIASRGDYQCSGTDSYVDDPSQCGVSSAPDPETAQYWAEHPELGNGAVPAPNPMIPGTADGYGPGVELPPFCARFPDDETCQ